MVAKTIGLVVEGPSETGIFRILKPKMKEKGFALKIITAGGKPRVIRDSERHARVLLNVDGCDMVVFLVDQDDDLCPLNTCASFPPLASKSVVNVVVREIEAWLLADPEIRTALTCRECKSDTGKLVKPSHELKDAHHRHFGWTGVTKVDLCSKLAKNFDPWRASPNNESLRRFLRIIQ